jgi:hypothetical protein
MNIRHNKYSGGCFVAKFIYLLNFSEVLYFKTQIRRSGSMNLINSDNVVLNLFIDVNVNYQELHIQRYILYWYFVDIP